MPQLNGRWWNIMRKFTCIPNTSWPLISSSACSSAWSTDPFWLPSKTTGRLSRKADNSLTCSNPQSPTMKCCWAPRIRRGGPRWCYLIITPTQSTTNYQFKKLRTPTSHRLKNLNICIGCGRMTSSSCMS